VVDSVQGVLHIGVDAKMPQRDPYARYGKLPHRCDFASGAPARHTSTALLRRDRADRVVGFDEEFRIAGEDYDFHLSTCREGPVGFIDLATISYQTGMPEQVVQQSCWMARGFLKTVTAALETDKERITLPRRMVNEVLVEANAWIAETLISRGDPREASGYFRRSLYHKPWAARAFVQMILCQLPPALGEVGRRAYRGLRRRGTPKPRRFGPSLALSDPPKPKITIDLKRSGTRAVMPTFVDRFYVKQTPSGARLLRQTKLGNSRETALLPVICLQMLSYAQSWVRRWRVENII
jgi:hypothetical protein